MRFEIRVRDSEDLGFRRNMEEEAAMETAEDGCRVLLLCFPSLLVVFVFFLFYFCLIRVFGELPKEHPIFQ